MVLLVVGIIDGEMIAEGAVVDISG